MLNITEFEQICMQSKSNNIFPCPKLLQKKYEKDMFNTEKVRWQNKMFRKHKCCNDQKEITDKKKKKRKNIKY